MDSICDMNDLEKLSESNKYLSRIFGGRNYIIIKSALDLPEKLPLIYLTLSKWKIVHILDYQIFF